MKITKLISFFVATFAILIYTGAGCTDYSGDGSNASNKDTAVAYITEVFQDNYPNQTEISVAISETAGDLVKGDVKIGTEDPHVFYAAKVDGEWDVIYDPEQKPYDCDMLRGYVFPEDMIVGCKEPVAEFTIGDAQEIQGSFADKYHKNVDDIVIKVDQYDATHARGIVQFAGEQGGGMFLAVKDQGAWDVIIDGNGSYECKFVEPYDFPEDMISDCY